MKNFICLVFLVQFTVIAQSLPAEHGTFSKSGYVEYFPGNIPVIISVPHDGEKAPGMLPDRKGQDFHTKADAHTQEMGLEIRAAFFKLTGKIPYLIINHLRRSKVDVNREIEEAAAGNKTAEMVWDEYHTCIDSAKEAVFAEFRKGLYIDLHAHNHVGQFIELGYLLDAEELDLSNMDLDDDLFIEKSSIRNLVATHPAKMAFTELLRGPFSLGAFLENAGYPAIPSPAHTSPNGMAFFRGGYSLNRHGSSSGGTIDGIQMETNMQNVRDNSTNIIKFSEAFTDIIVRYMEKHYNLHIGKKLSNTNESAE